jgi:hypothetical protein
VARSVGLPQGGEGGIYIHISVDKPFGNRHTEERILWKYNVMVDVSEMCCEDGR